MKDCADCASLESAMPLADLVSVEGELPFRRRHAGRRGVRRSAHRRGYQAQVPLHQFKACIAALQPKFVPSYPQVVDEIPKTASEKPRERFLLERFAPDAAGVYARA